MWRILFRERVCTDCDEPLPGWWCECGFERAIGDDFWIVPRGAPVRWSQTGPWPRFSVRLHERARFRDEVRDRELRMREQGLRMPIPGDGSGTGDGSGFGYGFGDGSGNGGGFGFGPGLRYLVDEEDLDGGDDASAFPDDDAAGMDDSDDAAAAIFDDPAAMDEAIVRATFDDTALRIGSMLGQLGAAFDDALGPAAREQMRQAFDPVTLAVTPIAEAISAGVNAAIARAQQRETFMRTVTEYVMGLPEVREAMNAANREPNLEPRREATARAEQLAARIAGEEVRRRIADGALA